MKHLLRILLPGSLTLAGILGLWSGCVGAVGVSGDDGVVYGGGPWFQGDVWLDGGGRGWYGGHPGGAYVHPGAARSEPARGGGHAAPASGAHGKRER